MKTTQTIKHYPVSPSGQRMATLTVHDPLTSGPKFPRSCPFCGAGEIVDRKAKKFPGAVEYGCGAKWTEKILITNRRDEWWLICAPTHEEGGGAR